MRWPHRPDDGGPRWPWRAEFGRGQARGAPRGLTWRELAETFSWRAGGSVADRRRQAGNGRARNRARARLNWVSQGQRWGRCRVRRRAERVSRPAIEKNRRRRVLVVTICAPRPSRAVRRARLCASTCTASQAPLAGEAPRGEMIQPHAVLEVSDGVLDLGVAAMVGLQLQGFPVPVGDAAVIAVGGVDSCAMACRLYMVHRAKHVSTFLKNLINTRLPRNT